MGLMLIFIIKSCNDEPVESYICQDGTVKLWEFESGRKLQSWDLGQLEDKLCSDTAKGNVR